jgi:carboxyl-terminal processing protease
LALVVAAFAGGAATSRLSNATSRDDSPYATFDRIARSLALVENDYVDPVERDKLLDGALRGMVAELDPHSSYLDADDFLAFQDDTEGRFAGVGIELDMRDGVLTVIAPIEGSPAERAGIKPGDRIVAIDGHSVDEAPLGKTVRKVRGPVGTHVKLTLQRQGSNAAVVVDLVRESIHVASVRAKPLDGDILYLRLKQFQEHTHEELVDAVAKARAPGGGAFSGVVLDLRNNPGGLVDQAAAVADEFLDGGIIYSTRHRGQVVDEVKAHGGGVLSRPKLVVLVNGYSASAAELVAGALQDNRRASIVGETTFGKGSVQTIFDLPGNRALRLTTMRYYTPSGRSIQARGIDPDVAIDGPRKADAIDATRERDLEGHLVEEAGGASHRATAMVHAPVGTVSEDTSLDPVSRIPSNPLSGKDYALAVAYRMLVPSAPSPTPAVSGSVSASPAAKQ